MDESSGTSQERFLGSVSSSITYISKTSKWMAEEYPAEVLTIYP